jgi:addiction module HigA family antidote
MDAPIYLDNPHPGVRLREDILEPLGISNYKLAKATGLTQSHIGDLVKGKRSITPETAMRLGKALNMSAEYWMGLQSHYDLIELRRKYAAAPLSVKPIITDELDRAA